MTGHQIFVFLSITTAGCKLLRRFCAICVKLHSTP